MTKRNNNVKPERLSLNLTPAESETFNTYIINLAKKRGRIPAGVKTKILKFALTEFFQHHGNDFDIDLSEKRPVKQ